MSDYVFISPLMLSGQPQVTNKVELVTAVGEDCTQDYYHSFCSASNNQEMEEGEQTRISATDSITHH